MSLAELENAFVKNIMKSGAAEEEFLSLLKSTVHLKPEKQLAIYRSNLNGLMKKVLEQIYPACFNILGEDYFYQIGRYYLVEFQSRNSDLNHFGGNLPAFLRSLLNSHNELSGFEYLPDLALFEWIWHCCYYADDNIFLEPGSLENMRPEHYASIIFKFNDALSIQKASYPIIDIWKANHYISLGDQEFYMPENELYYVISRKDFVLSYEIISEKEYEVLIAIENGNTLDVIVSDFNNDIQKYLPAWIMKGWVAGIALKD